MTEQRAMGCLPRTPRLMDAFPRAEDAVPIVPESEWSARMQLNTVKDAVWVVLDQDGVGSCASEATSAAVMIVREIENLDAVLLNPWSLYKLVNGGRDQGSGIDENLEAIMATGILADEYFPRSKGWKATPPKGWEAEAAKFKGIEAFDVKTKAEFGSCICAGLPVVYGVMWSSGGGHAICGVEAYPDELVFLNSWSKDFQDSGFGKMGWKQVMDGVKIFGAWALRVATYS
jgi:hypothetical protein